VLSSWESVIEFQPRVDDIVKCPGKVMIVTAAAPQGSPFDFCSRLFAPKLGLNEVKKLTCNFVHGSNSLLFTCGSRYQKCLPLPYLLGAFVPSGLCMWKCTLFISTLLEPQDEQV